MICSTLPKITPTTLVLLEASHLSFSFPPAHMAIQNLFPVASNRNWSMYACASSVAFADWKYRMADPDHPIFPGRSRQVTHGLTRMAGGEPSRQGEFAGLMKLLAIVLLE
jgi:hypothetical protein